MAPPADRFTRALLACGAAAPLFVPVLLAEGAYRPDYEPLHRFGSELALGERGWIQTANFIATGLLLLTFSVGVRRAAPTGRSSFALPALTALAGACLVVAGVFPTDPVGVGTAGATTPAGTVHAVNVLPFHAALTAAPLAMAWRLAAEPGRRAWVAYCCAAGALVPPLFAAFMASAEHGFHGLGQRVVLTVGLTWFAAAAWLLLRSTARKDPAPDAGGGKGVDGGRTAC
ncbi:MULTISPECIES: DUF998 domain-containing protein [Nocardiopsidaceae]|uniref:DUF998 domain-containing protein n=1 Tax=Streptomonospora nanhaiensis TaxID=1323731 RepID=A0ABY6YIF8_9ACTN|nr:DUF998 domain-containing protein [Streptomonospora nanhaiensis]WAE72070.1 DUF998 domain-containing protein [Streptomonospora nanhaiensis]